MFSSLKVWGLAILGAVLATLTMGVVTLKGQRDRAVLERDVAKATIHAERVKKKIEREKRKEVSRRETKIKEDIKDAKDPRDLDDLFNNDDWS